MPVNNSLQLLTVQPGKQGDCVLYIRATCWILNSTTPPSRHGSVSNRINNITRRPANFIRDELNWIWTQTAVPSPALTHRRICSQRHLNLCYDLSTSCRQLCATPALSGRPSASFTYRGWMFMPWLSSQNNAAHRCTYLRGEQLGIAARQVARWKRSGSKFFRRGGVHLVGRRSVREKKQHCCSMGSFTAFCYNHTFLNTIFSSCLWIIETC